MNDKPSDDAATLISIGALVSIVASLAHEVLGHGVGCAIDGGRITLLTFLVFRCAGAGVIADGGGPVRAFMVGCAALIMIWAAKPRAATVKIFLLTLGGLGILWFWGQMIREAIDGSDDWGHVAADLRWPAKWHTVVCCIGAVGRTQLSLSRFPTTWIQDAWITRSFSKSWWPLIADRQSQKEWRPRFRTKAC